MKTTMTLLCISILLSQTVQAETSDTFLGPLGGLRDKVNLEMVYTGEYGKSSGGMADADNYLDNLDITLTIDNLGREDSTLFIYFLYSGGDGPAEEIGDVQGASNIEAPTTTKLYELWYETPIAEQATLKFGLMDLNAEFDVIESAGLFINSSHGIGPDYAQSGVNGPSIFPTTSAGLRFDWQMNNGAYFRFAALDGVAGDPDDHHGTHVKFESDDGWLFPVEGGYIEGEPGMSEYLKFAAGAWYYTEPLAFDVNGLSISDSNNSGFYVLLDKGLTNNLAGYVRYGVADEELNAIEDYIGAGLVYSGLFENPDIQLGLSVAIANASAKLIKAVKAAGGEMEDNETVIELSLRSVINPWLAVQPDIQWIKNPGFDPSLDDATLYSIRFELTL